jgi:hypothetical protein
VKTKAVDVPVEVLELLRGSRLGRHPVVDQVRVALGIHLFLEGLVSVGKAAELAGVPRVEFEWLLVELGIPTVQYDVADAELDELGIVEANRRTGAL